MGLAITKMRCLVPGRLVLGFFLGWVWIVAMAAAQGPVAPGEDDRGQGSEAQQLAAHLVAEVPVPRLARAFRDDPELVAQSLEALATALATETVPEDGSATATARYLAALGRQVGQDLGSYGPPWSDDGLDLWLTVLLVHPTRFVEQPEFRGRVGAILPETLDPRVPTELRDRLLEELNRVRGFDFDLSERVELAWGAAPRSSATREATGVEVTVDVGAEGPLEATLLSLPSWDVGAEASEAFLAALEVLTAGRRDLLVVGDERGLERLARRPRGARTHLLPSHGRNYSLWPRDPLLFARRSDGGVLILGRPNPQPGREDDDELGRELIQQLPEDLDRRWGMPRWATAPVPFHHGQLLNTDDSVWISLHSLEVAILERLGVDRVPVSSFGTVEGVNRYLGAAPIEAERLAALFRRPVRFVHELPTEGNASVRQRAMARLGGGAGFDLDSLLTLLPGPSSTALVADLDLGLELLRGLPESDHRALGETYGLRVPVQELIERLGEERLGPRASGLDAFLEATASHLLTEGWRVERLPLLLVPTSFLAGGGKTHEHRHFLVGWNNVVLESRAEGRRAEGFASGMPAADAAVVRVFEQLGVRLDLLPPLVASIVRNGGYRCATNHLRAPRTTSSTSAPQSP